MFSSPGGTKMFQFPPFASIHRVWIIALQTIGLSHSEIAGSRDICSYPALIAAYHVLHRLREPRHPPCALSYFRQYDATQPQRPQKRTTGHEYAKLILSAVDSSNLQSCLCQYVKDRWLETPTNVAHASVSLLGLTDAYALVILFPPKWRITDSNR